MSRRAREAFLVSEIKGAMVESPSIPLDDQKKNLNSWCLILKYSSVELFKLFLLNDLVSGSD